MKKTINVSGCEVELSTNGLVPILYKKEFKRDFFADVKSISEKDTDVTLLYNFIWIFARIADAQIGSLEDWLEGFEEFPVMDFTKDVIELVTACITSKKPTQKNRKAAAKP